MKRYAIVLLTLLALTSPRLARAQYADVDTADYGAPPYNDVEDGQALRIAGYILAPFGYALEWGLTRPMHHLATDSPLAPALNGDTDIRYFGETANADRLPPGTFAPFTMPANPNYIESDAASRNIYNQPADLPPPPPSSEHNRDEHPYTYSTPPGGQSALH